MDRRASMKSIWNSSPPPYIFIRPKRVLFLLLAIKFYYNNYRREGGCRGCMERVFFLIIVKVATASRKVWLHFILQVGPEGEGRYWNSSSHKGLFTLCWYWLSHCQSQAKWDVPLLLLTILYSARYEDTRIGQKTSLWRRKDSQQ